MKKAMLVTLGLLGVGFLASAGRAQPNATYSLNTITYFYSPASSDPVSGTAGSAPLNVASSENLVLSTISASANATIVGGSDPILTSTATNGGVDSVATATLTYYFQVNSASSTYIPVNISGVYTDTNTSGLYSVGRALITSSTTYSSGGGFYIFEANTEGSGYSTANTTQYLQTSSGVSGTLTGNDVINWSSKVYVVPNQVFELQLYVNSNSAAGGTVTADIDPTISIDPTFLTANPADTLSFSPGFSPVPEPSTYALITGVAALGYAALRRKRAAA